MLGWSTSSNSNSSSSSSSNSSSNNNNNNNNGSNIGSDGDVGVHLEYGIGYLGPVAVALPVADGVPVNEWSGAKEKWTWQPDADSGSGAGTQGGQAEESTRDGNGTERNQQAEDKGEKGKRCCDTELVQLVVCLLVIVSLVWGLNIIISYYWVMGVAYPVDYPLFRNKTTAKVFYGIFMMLCNLGGLFLTCYGFLFLGASKLLEDRASVDAWSFSRVMVVGGVGILILLAFMAAHIGAPFIAASIVEGQSFAQACSSFKMELLVDGSSLRRVQDGSSSLFATWSKQSSPSGSLHLTLSDVSGTVTALELDSFGNGRITICNTSCVRGGLSLSLGRGLTDCHVDGLGGFVPDTWASNPVVFNSGAQQVFRTAVLAGQPLKLCANTPAQASVGGLLAGPLLDLFTQCKDYVSGCTTECAKTETYVEPESYTTCETDNNGNKRCTTHSRLVTKTRCVRYRSDSECVDRARQGGLCSGMAL